MLQVSQEFFGGYFLGVFDQNPLVLCHSGISCQVTPPVGEWDLFLTFFCKWKVPLPPPPRCWWEVVWPGLDRQPLCDSVTIVAWRICDVRICYTGIFPKKKSFRNHQLIPAQKSFCCLYAFWYDGDFAPLCFASRKAKIKPTKCKRTRPSRSICLFGNCLLLNLVRLPSVPQFVWFFSCL